MTELRVCWVLQSAVQGDVALRAGREMERHGIRPVIASWFTATCRHLYEQGCKDVYYLPSLLPQVNGLDSHQLEDLDQRYSPPGLAALMYSESRIRYLRDSAKLLPLTTQYLRFWERFLEEQDIDAVILWQSQALACRTLWTVAKAIGLPHLILTNGPSFDHMPLSDITEESIWSELVSAVESDQPRILTEEERQKTLEFIPPVVATHSEFMPRQVGFRPALVRLLKHHLHLRQRLHLEWTAKSRWSPEAVAKFPDNSEEIDILHRIQGRAEWHRFKWLLATRLGILKYTAPNLAQPYVYFPLQDEIDVKISARNPFLDDQVMLSRLIARAIPPGYKLYVKEHPSHPGKWNWSGLRELRRVSNIELVHPHTSSIELIKNAKAVVTVGSTAGWEGFLLQVPVVSLGTSFYSLSDLIFNVGSLNELPGKIRAALDSGPEMYQTRKEEWLWFIWQTLATCHSGSPFGYSSVFGAIPPKTSESDGALIGHAIADKLTRILRGQPIETAV